MPGLAHNACLTVAALAAAAAMAASAPQPSPRPALGSRIDAHAHVFNADPRFLAMLERLDVRLLNICVVDQHDQGFEEAEPQHARAAQVFRASRGRAAWCSTFDPAGFQEPGFASRTLASLERTFADGALAVKIYKSIGMELRSHDGHYVMPDDEAFAPVLEGIAARNRTLFAHIAEPSAAWKPLDPGSPHYSYYAENPDWHMYRHPERPSQERILAARDRMLERHPRLRVVGCHLGSMEDDVALIAQRLERYPNFAVDTAARVKDLMLQPREKVREFLIRYPDRILYATDLTFMPGDDAPAAVARFEATYARDLAYFATDEVLTHEGREVRGLALPPEVLRLLFHDNAVRWVPGMGVQASVGR
ncbi:MAG TPA: amidohydrolase family protein [Vicinamibacteria bacterium]